MRAFIANFLDNTVGVVDLDPRNATYQRMTLRIGRASDPLDQEFKKNNPEEL